MQLFKVVELHSVDVDISFPLIEYAGWLFFKIYKITTGNL